MLVISSIKSFNQKMGLLYVQDKMKAEKVGDPLPKLGKYIIYNRQHKPRQTGYIAYSPEIPHIKGIGETLNLAEFRFKKAREEYESFPLFT